MDLIHLRKEIDYLDKKLMYILVKRKRVVNKTFNSKAKLNLPIVDLNREKELLKSRENLARKLSLNPKFIKKLFKLIISNSKERHKKNG